MDAVRRYNHALVLGLGSSGQAAAGLLLREGARVTAVDAAQSAALDAAAAALRQAGAQVELGARELPAGAWDLCVVSPGIALSSPWVQRLKAGGVLVIPELELGASRCRCPILAVTGSNGKSTLVKLCAESLAAGGRRVAAGANYGEPLCDLAARSAELDWIVAEVSSFQLETAVEFRPEVGILLNLQPNHLNRHGTMAEYAAAKCRLFARMRPEDAAIVAEAHLEEARGLARSAAARWLSFGLGPAADYRFDRGAIRFGREGDRKEVSVAGTWFDNPVYGVSAAAAVAAAQACGVEPEAVARALETFSPLPHRRQRVATVRGVHFVDDSKATNLAALRAALETAAGRVRLIAGGQLKEHDLDGVKQILASRVSGAYLVGESADRMAAAWGNTVPCRVCGTLEPAVRAAWADAAPGEEILLSTGCASFDQFRSYKERGERFVQIVSAISKESRE